MIWLPKQPSRAHSLCLHSSFKKCSYLLLLASFDHARHHHIHHQCKLISVIGRLASHSNMDMFVVFRVTWCCIWVDVIGVVWCRYGGNLSGSNNLNLQQKLCRAKAKAKKVCDDLQSLNFELLKISMLEFLKNWQSIPFPSKPNLVLLGTEGVNGYHLCNVLSLSKVS